MNIEDSNYWDSLSLAEKAEMMKVAIANGITSLSEIRREYNKFADGGPTKTWTLEDEANYRKWRSQLPKNLRDTNDNDYDMRGAYKAGMQPIWNDEDKSYHLSSRDPETGRILKAPHHPTFLEALATDASMGYYPIIGKDGNVYTNTWKGNEHSDGGNLYFTGGVNNKESRPVAEDKNYNKVVKLYQGYIDRGIPPEAALDLTNQNIQEGGWNSWSSGDGKAFKTADGLINHVIDWHSRMYPDTLKSRNFEEFYNGLENGVHRYNSRYKGYMDELLNMRKGVKNRVNHYRAKLGQPALTLMDNNSLLNNGVHAYNLQPTDNQNNLVLPIEETPAYPIDTAPLMQENITADGGTLFADGGYAPSKKLKQDIATWEGSSMKTNRSFTAEAKDFNAVIPKEVRDKLSSKQLDALYSYGYNVGMGNLKNRVLPVLYDYTNGRATNEDVQQAMWASKDSQLRGLTNRRNWEREMFGGTYRSKYTGMPSAYQIPKSFFDNLNAEIQIPQLQMPNNIDDVDPALSYKPPVIDETLFQKPETPKPIEVYNPKQEALDRINTFNTVMGLMGGESPFSGLMSSNNTSGNYSPLGLIGQIYQ